MCLPTSQYCRDNTPALCDQHCGQYAHCAWNPNAYGCSNVPTYCSACSAFIFCVSGTDYCANAPSLCKNDCEQYALCTFLSADGASTPPMCANAPTYCGQQCQAYSLCSPNVVAGGSQSAQASLPPPSPSPPAAGSCNGSCVAAIVFGVLFGLALLAALYFYIKFKRSSTRALASKDVQIQEVTPK